VRPGYVSAPTREIDMPGRVQAAIAELTAPSAAPPHARLWPAWRVALRALLALAVLVLFYAFAIAVIVGLLLFTWLQLQFFKNGGGAIGILIFLPPLIALALLIALWPRFHAWKDPGRGLTPQRVPELFAMLREVARATGQPVPKRVYLVTQVNAWIANRGIFMGHAIAIGVPLFEIMTVDELRSVVAHELGHYARRGAGLGTLVHQTTRTFATAASAAGGIPVLAEVFELWVWLFLRVANPIAQQQELRSDELAYRTTGAASTVSALVKLHLADEFGGLDDADSEHNTRLFSTHPPLRDRVQLATHFGGTATLPADDRPALVLIEPLLIKDEPAAANASRVN
jgi:Zn-dependent protease with chaperone function